MDLQLSYIDPGSGFIIFSLGGWVVAFVTGLFGFVALYFKKILNFICHHWIPMAFILLGGVALGLATGGFFFVENKNKSFNHKIIILGMDGLSPKIMESMMTQGKLPSFSALKSQGSYRHLMTTNPSQSPVAWGAFSTGKNPGKTGMFDFILRDPKNYELKLSLSNIEHGKVKPIIKDKRLWHYTSERHIPTVIVGCPLTFPPDKINGRMLSGMGVPDILGTEGTFTFYTSEPLEKKEYTGGKVFQIRKSRLMQLEFIGPRTSSLTGKVDHVKEPFKVVLKDDQNAHILYRQNTWELKMGEWSDWQEVIFRLGFMKKISGIVKFYLISIEPEFNLYVSPINFNPKNSYFPISYPTSYSREIAKRLGSFYTQGMPVDTWAVNEGRLDEEASLEQIQTVFDEKMKLLEDELDRFKKGLLFFYLGMPDSIQHLFWRYIDPKHPLYQKDAPLEYREAIYRTYEKMDEVVGKVMRSVGPEDTLIVLSDHGFGTFRRSIHLNSWLRKNGYLVLKDEKSESGSELLSDVDWSKTKAYAIGFGGIYINQRGREKEGIVNFGSEADRLKKEISKKIEDWFDEKYQEPIVSKVYFKEDIFFGDESQNAPDLYVGFHEGYRASWQTAMGAVPEDLMEDNLKKWSGCHLFDPELVPGVLFINKQITQDKVSIYDIVPSVLNEIGYNDEEIRTLDLDGKVLW